MSLGSSWLWQFLRLSLFLMTLKILMNTGKIFHRVSLNWDVSVFPWFNWSEGILEEDHRGQVPFSSHNIKGVCVLSVVQWCPTLCDTMDCSPPGSFVHVIFQARILGWVAISYSRGSSQPRDQTHIFVFPALQVDSSLSHWGQLSRVDTTYYCWCWPWSLGWGNVY